MKKNEIALLILIVGIVATISYIVVNQLIGNRVLQPASVERVTPISAEIQEPNPDIFNDDAINPTVPVNIGDGNGQQPF